MTSRKAPTLMALSARSASPSGSCTGNDGSVTSSAADLEEFLDGMRRGKKRRLDHLTYEEKVQRKKLKNRVAAQTSRDRKKMKMDDMEANLQQLSDENTQLKSNFRKLEATNHTLRQQNESLQRQLEVLRQAMEDQEQRLAEQDQQLKRRDEEVQQVKQEAMDQDQVDQTVSSVIKSSSPLSSSVADIALKTGSAASTDVDPQQQGLSAHSKKPEVVETKSSTTPKKTTSSSVWQVIALCLLYKICSKQENKENIPSQAQEPLEDLTCSGAGKSWPKLYSQISPAKWQAMLREAATNLPRMQAPYHSCLDSWWGPEQSAWNPRAKVEA